MGCGCIAALFAVSVPRFTLFILWVFTNRLTIAFDHFWMGALGFAFIPYATVFYALCYAPVRGVTGFGWVIVAFGLVLDLSSYGAGERARRERYAAA